MWFHRWSSTRATKISWLGTVVSRKIKHLCDGFRIQVSGNCVVQEAVAQHLLLEERKKIAQPSKKKSKTEGFASIFFSHKQHMESGGDWEQEDSR